MAKVGVSPSLRMSPEARAMRVEYVNFEREGIDVIGPLIFEDMRTVSSRMIEEDPIDVDMIRKGLADALQEEMTDQERSEMADLLDSLEGVSDEEANDESVQELSDSVARDFEHNWIEAVRRAVRNGDGRLDADFMPVAETDAFVDGLESTLPASLYNEAYIRHIVRQFGAEITRRRGVVPGGAPVQLMGFFTIAQTEEGFVVAEDRRLEIG